MVDEAVVVDDEPVVVDDEPVVVDDEPVVVDDEPIVVDEDVTEDGATRSSEESDSLRYQDPAQRFTLQLPDDWDAEPIHFRQETTVFAGPGGQRLFIDVFPALPQEEPIDLIEQLIGLYSEHLENFQLHQTVLDTRFGGQPAVAIEYSYREQNVSYTEVSLFTAYGDRHYALQYIVPTVNYDPTARYCNVLRKRSHSAMTRADKYRVEKRCAALLSSYTKTASSVLPSKCRSCGLVFLKIKTQCSLSRSAEPGCCAFSENRSSTAGISTPLRSSITGPSKCSGNHPSA